MSGALPTPLGAAPIAASMAITDDPDFLALPASSAVVIIETPDRRTILIATTADARELARKRLAPPDPAQPRSARIDYHALARGGLLYAIPVGSSLEADAVYMHQARERLPHLAQVVAERRRAWFVHVDPAAEFPYWSKTNLIGGLVNKRSASTPVGGHELPEGFLLGPLPDKDSAGSFIEKVIDCFDLCRFHNLLVQAPKAVACAYKEMGRCDAPCDGTESMEAYRARVSAAARAIWTGGLHVMRVVNANEMRNAAAEGDYQLAATLRNRMERLAALQKPAFAHVEWFDAWRLLMMLPSTKKGAATIVLADSGALWRLGDVQPNDRPALDSVFELVSGIIARRRLRIDTEVIDSIGVLSRWLFLPEKKRRGISMRIAECGADRREAHAAIAKVCRRKGGDAEVESQEIEGAE